jgi:hypothetical protein
MSRSKNSAEMASWSSSSSCHMRRNAMLPSKNGSESQLLLPRKWFVRVMVLGS